MKKRIVSLLLALVMVLSLVPMSVFAADNHDGQVHVIVENTTYPGSRGRSLGRDTGGGMDRSE